MLNINNAGGLFGVKLAVGTFGIGVETLDTDWTEIEVPLEFEEDALVWSTPLGDMPDFEVGWEHSGVGFAGCKADPFDFELQ